MISAQLVGLRAGTAGRIAGVAVAVPRLRVGIAVLCCVAEAVGRGETVADVISSAAAPVPARITTRSPG